MTSLNNLKAQQAAVKSTLQNRALVFLFNIGKFLAPEKLITVNSEWLRA